MSMLIQGLPVLGQPIPPRARKPSPPSAEELRELVAAAEAGDAAAKAAEAALDAEWMELKGLLRRGKGAGLQEQRWALTQRQHTARRRASQAAETLKRARRALGRRGQEG